MILSNLKPALVMIILMTVLLGGVYPAAVTAVASVLFPRQASGSLLVEDGKVVGSALIGQAFADPKHFWSRPSATAPYPYNASASSGSNMGPLNPALTDAVTARIKALRDVDPNNAADVPVDLVTASGSGLDPHISPAAAQFQVQRVARVRGMDPTKVTALVERFTEGRQFGFFGEPRVNVLRLNLALDAIDTQPTVPASP
jgi:potassium-transporting ATPase KdpC subunit